MPPDHYPATVYRYTKTRGWERYRASTPQFARRRLLAAAGQRRQGGVSVSGEHEVQPSSQTVCAVPRRGCVEVRALRLRIRLFAEEDPNDDVNYTVPGVRAGVPGVLSAHLILCGSAHAARVPH